MLIPRRKQVSYKQVNRRRTSQQISDRIKNYQRSAIFILLGVITCIVLLVSVPGAVPIAWGEPTRSPSANLTDVLTRMAPPQFQELERNIPGISNLLNPVTSALDKGSVRLDGRSLFTIAVEVPTPNNNSGSNGSNTASPIEQRVNLIENRLWRIIDRGFDPATLNVITKFDNSSRQPVIYVDYTSGKTSYEDEILTVTGPDAKANGTDDIEEWSNELSQIIKQGLLTAQQERQPEYLQRQGYIAAGILFAMAAVSLLLSSFQRRLRAERKHLSAQSKTDTERLSTMTSMGGESHEATTTLLQRRTDNQQKRDVNDVKRRLSQLGQLFVWGLGIFLILGLFPYSRWLQPLLVSWIKIPIRLLLIALVTYILIRLSGVLVDRFFWALQSSATLAPSSSHRLILRFTTFSRVAKSVLVGTCALLGIVLAVAVIGVQVSPVFLALTGIIGVGVSLASQNLIKDVINGFLILLEDQYGVGDVIVIGEVGGFVENMNLRITQLRNDEGRLITIPNSSITVVQNLSKEWSRVDINVSVAYDADLDRALAVIKEVAEEMSQDPNWRNLILEPPLLLGVEKLDYAGAAVRLWIKTQPLKQWDVAREYRRRLKLAFDKAHIQIGVPQQSLWFSNASDFGSALSDGKDKQQMPQLTGLPQDSHRHSQ